MRTSKASNNFSVSNIDSEGWNEGMTQYEKESYIRKDIAHKTAYRQWSKQFLKYKYYECKY